MELKRRLADADNPVRYVVFSDITVMIITGYFFSGNYKYSLNLRVVFEAIQQLMAPPEEPEKKWIGFDVRESRAKFRAKKPSTKKCRKPLILNTTIYPFLIGWL